MNFGIPVYFWLAAVIVFSIVEAATAGIVSVWFAFGALCALIAAAFNASLAVQIIVFLFFSALSLILTRPLIKRRLLKKTVPTNSDALIGKQAVVCEAINNLSELGAVKAEGKIWTARSLDGGEIPAGAIVTVVKIEGVKLIVK